MFIQWRNSPCASSHSSGLFSPVCVASLLRIMNTSEAVSQWMVYLVINDVEYFRTLRTSALLL